MIMEIQIRALSFIDAGNYTFYRGSIFHRCWVYSSGALS